MTEFSLCLSGIQYNALQHHLFPGDGKEAVAIALCGRRAGHERHKLTVRAIHPIRHEDCSIRTPETVTWSTEILIPWLQEADEYGLSVVKIHSHTSDFQAFSKQDDQSDGDLFPSIAGWIDADVPHASVVMLPDGRMFGRAFAEGAMPVPLATISVAGDDLLIWHHDEFGSSDHEQLPLFTKRHAQAFGEITTRKLRRLSVGVIGCSGTGSIVIEQLARLGVGRLVLVDNDVVKILNLNRIINATEEDATKVRYKVDVMSEAITRLGFGTIVESFKSNLKDDPDAVRAVAGCDVIFGCVDTAEGRFVANLIATFYLVPYIDVGVSLDADDSGAITQVCGYVHYVQPDLSSLLSRGAISLDDVQAEGLLRQNPDFYETHRKAGYIRNVVEERPAVISVNMALASLAVNELLARIHGFRDEPNIQYGTVGVSISQLLFYPERESGTPCKIIAKHAGRGDVVPLLEQPELSEHVL